MKRTQSRPNIGNSMPTATAFSGFSNDSINVGPRTVEDIKAIYEMASDAEAATMLEYLQKIKDIPDEDERRKEAKRLIAKDGRKFARETRKLDEDNAADRLIRRSCLEVTRRLERLPQPFKLEKCKGPVTPLIKEAFRKGAVRYPGMRDNPEARQRGLDSVFAALKLSQVLVIGHDWAGAMAKADLDADFKLPYDHVCFEMVVGGRPVVVLAMESEGPGSYIGIQCLLNDDHGNWVLPGLVEWIGGRWNIDIESAVDRLIDYVGMQIRACCIALDAEVAETTPQRAPHLSNRPRGEGSRGDVYHVVSLAKRPRAARLNEPGEPGHHVRLHFRRGHWRHYENHKTWIKWMMVGDPDLGVVEKHYKL